MQGCAVDAVFWQLGGDGDNGFDGDEMVMVMVVVTRYARVCSGGSVLAAYSSLAR